MSTNFTIRAAGRILRRFPSKPIGDTRDYVPRRGSDSSPRHTNFTNRASKGATRITRKDRIVRRVGGGPESNRCIRICNPLTIDYPCISRSARIKEARLRVKIADYSARRAQDSARALEQISDRHKADVRMRAHVVVLLGVQFERAEVIEEYERP